MPPSTYPWERLDRWLTSGHLEKWGILLAKKWGKLNGQSHLLLSAWMYYCGSLSYDHDRIQFTKRVIGYMEAIEKSQI